MIPVFDRYARGWPEHGPTCTSKRCKGACPGPGPATYGPLADALTTVFDWDAHFSAYSVPTIAHRLAGAKAIESVGELPMLLFIVDVEPAKHAPPTPEWYNAETEKIDALLAVHPGGYFYTTRGGYRLVWQLPQPFIIATERDARRWSAAYIEWLNYIKRTFGIEGDTTCKDWGRLYRLPHVTRDGVVQTPQTYGDAHAVGAWDLPVPELVESAPTALIAVEDQGTPATPELLEHVRERLRQLGPAIEGQGGDQHTFRACAMVCRGYALNDAEATQLLSEWNATCVPPWDGDELRTKMDNAANYGQGDEGEARAEWASLGGIKTALLAAAPQPITPTHAGLVALFSGAGSSPLPAEPTADPGSYFAALQQASIDIVNHQGATNSTAEESPFFTSARSLFAGADLPPSWLVEKLIVDGGFAVIATEPKSAKTWLATELSIAVALGSLAIGKYQAKRKKVAYFYTEDMRDAIKTRVRALCAGRGLSVDALADTFHAQPRGKSIDLTKLEDCARIIASCRMIGDVGLLVLDPLRNIHTGEEDKADAMSAVFRNLRMIGTLLDCTILIVHHAAKASDNTRQRRPGQRMRGSGAIHGFVDSGIYLEDLKTPDPATFINTVRSEVKAARGAGMFELTLKIEDNPITDTAVRAKWEWSDKIGAGATVAPEQVNALDDTAREIVDAYYVAEQQRRTPNTQQIRQAVKGGSNTFKVALHVALTRGWLTKDVSGKYGITVPGRKLAEERRKPAVAAPPEDPPDPALEGFTGALE